MKEIHGLVTYSIQELEEMNGKKFDSKILLQALKSGDLKGTFVDGEWYIDRPSISFWQLDDEIKSKMEKLETRAITLSPTGLEGRILDLGGGGEGIIERLKGENVVAIDPLLSELEEVSAREALKIVMDARDLKFLAESFDTVSSFFTLMYIENNDHTKVFEEVYRVLKKGGSFFIWDLEIPERLNKSKNIYAVSLQIRLSNKIVETGYGTKWEDKVQNLNYFEELGRKAGFEVVETSQEKEIFHLKFEK